MPKQQTENSPAYELVHYVFRNSPGTSWRNLNAALHGALRAAIQALLPFYEDDFTRIYNDFNGAYWMGRGNSTVGEEFYSLAVQERHTPACRSFEKFAKRQPALWAENSPTPYRLAIGVSFTWEGEHVTVTSMHQDRLIACSYDHRQSEPENVEEGEILYVKDYRKVLHVSRPKEGKELMLHLGEPIERPRTAPKRIFNITYQELKQKRKEYDQRRQDIIGRMDRAATPAELLNVYEEVVSSRAQFRHFDIDQIRQTYQICFDRFDQSDKERAEKELLERWTNGENVPRYFNEIRLRIKGNKVETSNGHYVPLEDARCALPLVLKRDYDRLIGRRIGLHSIQALTKEHLVVGCTPIPYAEIERIAPLLQEAQ